jgi:ribosomal RNA-processing protein 17
LRDERKADLERHVAEVNALLDPPEAVDGDGSDDDGEAAEEWNGVEDVPPIDHEAEYIDEDKYTTVTVEALDLSKGGLQKVEQEGRNQEDDEGTEVVAEEDTESKDAAKPKKRPWTKEKPRDRTDKPKPKKKKFRYETKSERKFTRMKQGARNSREAKARREKE